ncbi:MAG: PfkB family carbohydrate kinase [Candidatus Bathyarchaeia archaeon]
MSIGECKKELENFVKQELKECKVTVLPDFFLDRLINLYWNPKQFSRLIEDVAKHKGGSLDRIPQADMQGGNAINVASALANLGAKVTPIVCTSEWGLQLIKYYFRNTSVDTSHVKVLGKASITTALEFKNKDTKTNVMIRDLGALENFGPDNLNEDDYAVIEDADYTCLFNWAGTLLNGTQLAQTVFSRTKKRGKGQTYYDTADPTPNLAAVPDLIKKIFQPNLIDVLSLNENEAIVYARLFDGAFVDKKERLPFEELAMEAARVLAKHLKARIDLHTFCGYFEGENGGCCAHFQGQGSAGNGRWRCLDSWQYCRRPQRSFRYVPVDFGECCCSLLPVRSRRQTSNLGKSCVSPQNIISQGSFSKFIDVFGIFLETSRIRFKSDFKKAIQRTKKKFAGFFSAPKESS